MRGGSGSTAIGTRASVLLVRDAFFGTFFGLEAIEMSSTASQIILGLRSRFGRSEIIVKWRRNALFGMPRKKCYISRRVM
jgi:hypothetical protein